ncbi:hypothetical protein [Bosea sp. (in: a-proteobacteria)]|jgi:hypothetical protein|uniref:hypothetical protein n=1 Tax=Bosea sp. (in: a-proteobacteria) TaxID=1871050 RepID=UPI003F6FDBE0
MPELPHPEAPTLNITSHADYLRARQRLDELQGSALRTAYGLELASLSAAIAAYESTTKGPGSRG